MADVTIQNLVQYQIGELPGDSFALLLAYATSQEKLSKGEMETFVIGMTRDMANSLADELKKRAGAPQSGAAPKQQH